MTDSVMSALTWGFCCLRNPFLKTPPSDILIDGNLSNNSHIPEMDQKKVDQILQSVCHLQVNLDKLKASNTVVKEEFSNDVSIPINEKDTMGFQWSVQDQLEPGSNEAMTFAPGSTPNDSAQSQLLEGDSCNVTDAKVLVNSGTNCTVSIFTQSQEDLDRLPSLLEIKKSDGIVDTHHYLDLVSNNMTVCFHIADKDVAHVPEENRDYFILRIKLRDLLSKETPNPSFKCMLAKKLISMVVLDCDRPLERNGQAPESIASLFLKSLGNKYDITDNCLLNYLSNNVTLCFHIGNKDVARALQSDLKTDVGAKNSGHHQEHGATDRKLYLRLINASLVYVSLIKIFKARPQELTLGFIAYILGELHNVVR